MHQASDQIDRIIRHALGQLADWRRPKVLKSVGPAFPEVFDAFEAELDKLRHDIRATLEALYQPEELTVVFPQSDVGNPLLDIHSRHGTLARRISKAKEIMPQWFVGGWSIEGKEVDLTHWHPIPGFTLTEATLLSIGCDPRHCALDAMFKTYGRSDEADTMLYFLEDRLEQIARAFGLDQEDTDTKIAATDFLIWVQDHSVQIDDRFRRKLKERQARQKLATPTLQAVAIRAEERPLHSNSEKAHARLVLSLAIQTFGLDAEKRIGAIAKKMAGETDLTGLSVDAKTIRKLLQLGWSQLSPDCYPNPAVRSGISASKSV
jgi:hypothetical protein